MLVNKGCKCLKRSEVRQKLKMQCKLVVKVVDWDGIEWVWGKERDERTACMINVLTGNR